MENELTIDGLIESLGIKNTESEPPEPQQQTEPAQGTDDQNNPGTEPAQTEPNNGDDGQQEPAAEPGKANDPQNNDLPLQNLNKEAYAFAEMRKKISSQDKVLTDIATMLGIKGSNSDEILNGLKNVINAKQAKDSGIPPEIMQRLTALEQEKAERDAKDRRLQAYANVNNLEKELKLERSEVMRFLTELASDGLNIFETNVNLKAEYLSRNFDKMLEAAKKQAVEEQVKRDAEAARHSSNPGTQTGSGAKSPSKIDTFDGLDKFLKENIK